jgi:hypothetical protein
MHWEKLGLLYSPPQKNEWLQTHAANPLPIHVAGDVYRIFYSGRNNENRSSVGCVDIDIIKKEVIQDNQNVVFKYGPHDSFYSHGVSIGNAFQRDGYMVIPYMGWKIENKDHWYGTVGTMILTPDLKVDESQSGLIFMNLDEDDPISLSYPWVVHEDGVYKMWYGSTLSWESDNGEMVHVIKYATSNDGINWDKHGVAVPYEIGIAQAFSRPTVMRHKDVLHMWYSYRSGSGKKYRIGYARSKDGGATWIRRHNNLKIDISVDGWDSEMVCYPYVFRHKENIYMIYNGDGYGKTGFGIAQLIGKI